jgi:hypothetical protein
MIIQISFIFFIGNSRQAKIQNKKFKDKFIQVYIIAKKKKKKIWPATREMNQYI